MLTCVAYINFQVWFDATSCVNLFQFIPIFQDVKRSVFRIDGIIPMVSKHLTNIFCRNINIVIASLQRESDHHLTIVYYCIHHTGIDNFWPENFPLFIASNSLKQMCTKIWHTLIWWWRMKICNTVSESKFKVPANDFILEFVYYPRFWHKNHNTLAKGSTNILRQTGYVDIPVVLGARSGIWQALLWGPN